MEFTNRPMNNKAALKIVGVYFLFGCIWIYLSDEILGKLVNDPVLLTQIAIYKGMLFISTTAMLLYILLARYAKYSRKSGEALREQEAVYREAIAQGDAVPYQKIYEPPHYVFLDDGIARLCGYTAAEVTPSLWQSLVKELIFRGKLEGMTQEEAARKAWNGEIKEWRTENRIVDRVGRTHWIADSAIQMFDLNGKPYGSIGILQDITTRKLAEQQMVQSLHEKELLLKEIHHRVKNNLQVVSSLLNLQANHIKDPLTREIFKESQVRVKSMALIHEKLYQSKDLARIDVGAYIKTLGDYLYRTYVINADTIKMSVHAEDIQLGLDGAIPCGLIINELISNSLKHAFPGGRRGAITINLTKDTGGAILLAFRDDGVGMPPDQSIEKSPTLGLQLVHSLAEQLRATVNVRVEAGTEFTIRFPEPVAQQLSIDEKALPHEALAGDHSMRRS